MARLITSKFWNRFIVANVRLLQQIQPHRNMNLFIQQRQKLPPPMMVRIRSFASYGVDLPPVDPKEVELRVFKSLSTHDKIDPKNVSFNLVHYVFLISLCVCMCVHSRLKSPAI